MTCCSESYFGGACSAIVNWVNFKFVVEQNFFTLFLVEVDAYFVLSASELVFGGFGNSGSRQGVHLVHKCAYPHDPHEEDGKQSQPEGHPVSIY